MKIETILRIVDVEHKSEYLELLQCLAEEIIKIKKHLGLE